MAIPREAVPQLSDRFAALLPHLNERQRRLALGVEARLLGHGGVGTVARVAEVSETTVRRGIAELAADRGSLPDGRARAPGGGRRRAEDNNPAVLSAVVGRQNLARSGIRATEPVFAMVGLRLASLQACVRTRTSHDAVG